MLKFSELLIIPNILVLVLNINKLITNLNYILLLLKTENLKLKFYSVLLLEKALPKLINKFKTMSLSSFTLLLKDISVTVDKFLSDITLSNTINL